MQDNKWKDLHFVHYDKAKSWRLIKRNPTDGTEVEVDFTVTGIVLAASLPPIMRKM